MAEQALIEAARRAASGSYSPYSGYAVGAALQFDDGGIVTGTNIENASYGLALCAETVAAAIAMAEGRRGGLVAVAVTGPNDRGGGAPTTPCGRCQQVL
ncbi:MAG: cytidine deaminase, partial [Qipengyuania sp.]